MAYADWTWEDKWEIASPGRSGSGYYAKRFGTKSRSGYHPLAAKGKNLAMDYWLRGNVYSTGAYLIFYFSGVTIANNVTSSGVPTVQISYGGNSVEWHLNTLNIGARWEHIYVRVWLDNGTLFGDVSLDGETWLGVKSINGPEWLHDESALQILCLNNYNDAYWMGIDDLTIALG